jgi:hypothetical protein
VTTPSRRYNRSKRIANAETVGLIRAETVIRAQEVGTQEAEVILEGVVWVVAEWAVVEWVVVEWGIPAAA